MRRILVIAALLVICTGIAGAQRRTTASEGSQPWKKQLALDGALNFPGGDTKDILDLSMGFGIAGTFYYQLLTRHTFLSASIGYHSFGVGSTGSNVAVSVIPLLIGARYNFVLTGVQPYIGIEAGAYITSVTSDGSVVEGSGGTDFGLMPKVGVRVPVEPQFDLDFSLKYNVILSEASFSYIGINAGVAYTID